MENLFLKLMMGTVAIVGILVNNQFPKAINPASSTQGEPQIIQQINWAEIGEYKYTPTHKQLVWRYVLEWCESKGDGDAVNPKDKDGTPSYYHFQFKWDTLKGYIERYKLFSTVGLEETDFINWASDYNLTSEILNRMINDPNVVWKQEFPQCLKQIGYPPLLLNLNNKVKNSSN